MKPLFERCSYSCRRAYARLEPYSQCAGFSLRGLAAILVRRSPLSTGAIPADSFAIFRVYVSVILSALNCALTPFSVKSLITSSRPRILTFIFILIHAQYIRLDFLRRFLFYLDRKSTRLNSSDVAISY